MLNGIIPKDVIELIDKGLTKDEDVQDAYDTGKAEGRNQKIEMKKPVCLTCGYHQNTECDAAKG